MEQGRRLERVLEPTSAVDVGAGLPLRRGLPAAAALRAGFRGGGHDLDGLHRARARRSGGDLEEPRRRGDHTLRRRHDSFSGPDPVRASSTSFASAKNRPWAPERCVCSATRRIPYSDYFAEEVSEKNTQFE